MRWILILVLIFVWYKIMRLFRHVIFEDEDWRVTEDWFGKQRVLSKVLHRVVISYENEKKYLSDVLKGLNKTASGKNIDSDGVFTEYCNALFDRPRGSNSGINWRVFFENQTAEQRVDYLIASEYRAAREVDVAKQIE